MSKSPEASTKFTNSGFSTLKRNSDEKPCSVEQPPHRDVVEGVGRGDQPRGRPRAAQLKRLMRRKSAWKRSISGRSSSFRGESKSWA